MRRCTVLHDVSTAHLDAPRTWAWPANLVPVGVLVLLYSRCHGRVAEWQTRWLQVPVSFGTWGFKSPFAHQERFYELQGRRLRTRKGFVTSGLFVVRGAGGGPVPGFGTCRR